MNALQQGLMEKIPLRGFFRVNIVNPGKAGKPDEIVGDSGWIENQVTNEGFRAIARLIGGISGSSQVTHAAVGTGGAPAAADTTLTGEQSVRAAVTAATSSNSKAVSFTATFDSAVSFVTATKNLSNIGLGATSTAGAATIFCGAAYASSAVATNQNVNITYTINLA
jgi:hypothetical protein